MKKNVIYSIILVLTLLLVGCIKQTDVYEEFVVPGGRIYPGIVSNPQVLSGDNRVMIVGRKPMGADVSQVKVFWNYFEDSVSYTISDDRKSIVEVEIKDLEERAYLFTIYTYNKQGNKSVPTELYGEVFGDNYRLTLINRLIESAKYMEDKNGGINIAVNYSGPPEDALFSELIYTNLIGKESIVKVTNEQDEFIIVDGDYSRPITYRTAYVPDSLAVDTFYAEMNTIAIQYPTLSIKGFSSQHTDGTDPRFSVINIIDGVTKNNLSDPNRYWHTKVGETYPHWVTLDLGMKRPVSGVEIFKYPGDKRAMSKFILEISDDNKSWTSLGEFSFDIKKEGGQPYNFIEPLSTRFIKLTGIKPGEANDFLVLGEIVVH